MPQQVAQFPNMNVCKNALKIVHGSLHFHENGQKKLYLSFRTEKNDQEIAEIFRFRGMRVHALICVGIPNHNLT